MPPTLGDRIAAKKKADAELKPARDAVTTAGSAYAAAMAAVEAANASLRIDLKASGPVYIVETGSGKDVMVVFVADESEAGFRSFSPVDAATIPASETPPAPVEPPVPVQPPAPVEPTPAGGPTVEPAPAEAKWNEVPKPQTPPT